MEALVFKKELEIVISPQALKVLEGTKYTVKDFKEWALKDQKISLGGSNVMLFLESMYNKRD
ncbi:hypothetical protein [Oceanihabitans sediminis]|uniref:hypothetical protein n=1 Tax=Oceanihabitans sediminis TaxID=1812012 RepID=UPI00299D79F4|nr:hypothetical protein [Oceanihabitans sediminis]MDX1278553.1 hypothetical protein [Oceanihabitans sediminis]